MANIKWHILSILFCGDVILASLTYRAGVVEFNPVNTIVNDVVAANLEEYIKIINNTGQQELDILVFPEATLNRHWSILNPAKTAIKVPSPDKKIVPCGNGEYSIVLQKLSCAAKMAELYLIVNVGEAVDCDELVNKTCNGTEITLFNTNVVFDRNGTVISRYRKINLWNENGFTPSQDESLGIFETDFGVTFGHFTCFDLLFQSPAVATVERAKVQNVLFPTMWFSQLPSLTAIEIQSAWAYIHNVNLLAAGANNPSVGSTGSGIYLGKGGPLKTIMSGQAKTEVLIADVPKIPNSIRKDESKILESNRNPAMDSLFLKKHNLTRYDSALIDETKEFQELKLSYANSTCIFNIHLKNLTTEQEEGKKQYKYRAIIYDGLRSFQIKNAGITECGLVACTSIDLLSCAERFPKYSDIEPTFEISKIELLATVARPKFNVSMQTLDAAYYPVTLTTSILPLSLDEYEYELNMETDGDQAVVKMTTNTPQSELLMFGIFGRTYFDDHPRG